MFSTANGVWAIYTLICGVCNGMENDSKISMIELETFLVQGKPLANDSEINLDEHETMLIRQKTSLPTYNFDSILEKNNLFLIIFTFLDVEDLKCQMLLKKSIFAKCRVMYETSITADRALVSSKQLLTEENVLLLAISSLEVNKWFKSLLTSEPENCDQFYKNAFAALKNKDGPTLPSNQFRRFKNRLRKNRTRLLEAENRYNFITSAENNPIFTFAIGSFLFGFILLWIGVVSLISTSFVLLTILLPIAIILMGMGLLLAAVGAVSQCFRKIYFRKTLKLDLARSLTNFEN